MKHSLTYLSLVGFAVITGATFNLAKYTVEFFSPSSAAAWRFGIAAVVMLLIMWKREGIRLHHFKQNGKTFLLLGIIGIFGFNALFFLGLQHTSAINGALIMGTNPVLSTILARFILKEKITANQSAGVILALIGVGLVITHGSMDVIKNLSFSIGDFIIMMGNLCWALYGVLGRKFVKSSSSLATTTYTMVIGAGALILLSLFSDQPASQEIPLGAWGSIVFMALFTSVLGYLWWNRAIQVIGIGKTSLFFNLVPVVTMTISAVSGIGVEGIQLAGAALVIAGVLTSSGIISKMFISKTEVQLLSKEAD
ncbi:DMT family transporter [Falsibacillus pallidus]|uniref:DMT family transporter n=1 Tax=Falsibacillus pallidus TaxID=493781 RepID=UPI003D964B71